MSNGYPGKGDNIKQKSRFARTPKLKKIHDDGLETGTMGA